MRNIGINVQGFIISDGQCMQDSYKDIPVYYFSEIPHDFLKAFVVMSFDSEEIESLLSNAGYEYLPLPFQVLEMLR